MTKYEYMLQTWGGFYNDEYREKHGYTGGYFWFDTAEERQRYISELREAEDKFGARILVIDIKEGSDLRQRTVAKMTFSYMGREYQHEEDFGFAFPEENARYMFNEGNYSCDCNRSLRIQERYADFPELGCGNGIVMSDFRIEFRY